MFKSLSITVRIAIVVVVLSGLSGSVPAIQSVAGPEPVPAAEGNALNNNLPLRLELQVERSKLELGQKVAMRFELQNKLGEIIRERKELLERQDALGVSNESFAEIIRTLQASRVELIIDLAGIEARREALISDGGVKESNQATTELIPLLEQMVEVRSKDFDARKRLYERGSESERAMVESESELLDAKIRLAETKAMVGGSWNRAETEQLRELSLDGAEKNARLEKIGSLLVQFTSEREAIQSVSRLDSQSDNYLKQIQAAEMNIKRVEARIRSSEYQTLQLLDNAPKADK